MTLHAICDRTDSPPRSDGRGVLAVKRRDAATVLDRVRTSGALKLLFPGGRDPFEAVLINTSGGLTGGDRQDLQVSVGAGARMSLTTQAAERVYRAEAGHARVTSRLTVAKDARLDWLPQELILFDRSALDRHLTCDLAEGASFLFVEPLVFGRRLMGETLRQVALSDRVEIRRAGRPLYRDAIRFQGDFQSHIARTAIGHGASAMASVVYAAPDAAAHVGPIRLDLPPHAGVSLLQDGCLVARIMAEDSHLMRRALIPVLERLSGASLPKSWSL
jgi:urease accessory protein